MDQDRTHYSMLIEWEPKGQVFVVTIPELRGCRTHGETYEEAVGQGQEVIEAWIEAMQHWGRPVPPPRYLDLGEVETAEPVGTSTV